MTERRMRGRDARLYAIAAIAAIYVVAWFGIAPELAVAPPPAAPIAGAAPARSAPAVHRVAPVRAIRVRTRSS